MQTIDTNENIVISGLEKFNLYDQPIAEASSFEFSAGMEKRSLSTSEDERKPEDSDDCRKSPETSPTAEMRASPVHSMRSLPVVSPNRSDRSDNMHDATTWKSDSYLMTFDNDDDDISIASGYSIATYDTNATSESVQDIISRLQSETDRRRRRLMRRRSSRRNGDKLQKYASARSAKVDPKLGITVEIKE